MCGNEKKGKKNSSRSCRVRQKTQTIAYYQCWVQAKMFAQTFDDLFSIKGKQRQLFRSPSVMDMGAQIYRKVGLSNLVLK